LNESTGTKDYPYEDWAYMELMPNVRSTISEAQELDIVTDSTCL
jgi:hypothetical protein